ncbi:MAG TPA: hypothetical protein VF538_04720 [Pyrinomonadaceae bacterium]|jgi:hypothetical protein
MQNPPPNYPPQNPAPQGQPYGQPTAPKKSKAPWIIGGVLGCLVIVVVVLFALGGLAYLGFKKADEVASTLNANSRARNANRGASPVTTAPRAGSPASGTTRYVNERGGFTGTLAQNFVDFSFDYPEGWRVVPNETKNFVKVERDDDNGTTLENFAVGWISATGTALDKQLMPQLAGQLSSQFAQGFKGYEKVSEGETRVGDYEAYEVKFKADLPGAAGGDATVFGRAVLIPPPSGTKKGVALIMLTTDRADGIESPDDVGVRGEMPVILETFRLGS